MKVDLRSYKSRIAAILRPKPKRPRVRKRFVRKPYPPKGDASYSFEIVSSGVGISTTYIYGGSTINESRAVVTAATIGETKQTLNTPSFRNLKKKALPNNPYYRRWYRVDKATPYVSDFVDWQSGYGYRYTLPSAALKDPFVPSAYKSVSNTEEQATYFARKRLADRVNKMPINLGVAFAERRQTANLIASTAYRIAHAASSLKKGDLRSAYGLLGIDKVPSQKELDRLIKTPPSKRVSNHWLELQFGWKPLLNDLDGAAELLAKHVVGNVYHTENYGSATVRKTTLLHRGSYPFEGWIYQKSRVRFVYRYRLDNYARMALSSTGISNPLTVAWEILPYSFVVDWFIPVSGFLQRLYSFDGFEVVQGTKSVIWEGEVYKSFTESKGYPSQSRGSASGEAKWSEFSYNRTVENTFPPWVLPSFRNPLENGPLWKFVTSMALMRQAFGRRDSSDGSSSLLYRL